MGKDDNSAVLKKNHSGNGYDQLVKDFAESKAKNSQTVEKIIAKLVAAYEKNSDTLQRFVYIEELGTCYCLLSNKAPSWRTLDTILSYLDEDETDFKFSDLKYFNHANGTTFLISKLILKNERGLRSLSEVAQEFIATTAKLTMDSLKRKSKRAKDEKTATTASASKNKKRKKIRLQFWFR